MKFDDAIAAHSQWKVKLRMYISGTGEKHDPNVVCKDNLCALGKWIYGEGAKYKTDPLFEPLRISHAEFHKVAAEVIRKVDAKDKTGAETLLNGQYTTVSSQVVTAIIKMKGKHPGE